MLSTVRHSILLRMVLLLLFIVGLAVTGLASSGVITQTLRGEAAAINIAGSLRMQSHLLSARLLALESGTADIGAEAVTAVIEEFQARLHSPVLTDALPQNPSELLRETYAEVLALWETRQLPLVRSFLDRVRAAPARGSEQRGAAERSALLGGTGEFVALIDVLVKRLEENTEGKVQRLQTLQIVTLIGMLLIAAWLIAEARVRLLRPLGTLLSAAERARSGDFSWRLEDHRDDELGELARAFDRMASDLSALYEGLEQRVAEKTCALEQSNRSLSLLFQTIVRLNESPPLLACRTLLSDLVLVLEARAASVCLAAAERDRALIEVSAFPSRESWPDSCRRELCAECLAGEATRVVPGDAGSQDSRHILYAPLRDQTQTYGMLVVAFPGPVPPAAWQVRLGEALGHHIGIAIGRERQAVQGRRLALLEERGAIARELHDSLAQSLAFLKIQVTRLQNSLEQGGERAMARDALQELRTGLNSAYLKLRELITTFRIQMDARGLGRALEQTVQEFQARTDTRISLDNPLHGARFTPNEEINLLQIVREALANIVHHARARTARVALESAGDGGILVTIADDGVGLPAGPAPALHYGLAIMHERARSIGGRLEVETIPSGGSRIQLYFVPRQDALAPAAGTVSP